MPYELQNSIAVLYELLGLRPNMNYAFQAYVIYCCFATNVIPPRTSFGRNDMIHC